MNARTIITPMEIVQLESKHRPGTCDTCKYWDRDSDGRMCDYPSGSGQSMPTAHRQCRSPHLCYVNPDADDRVGASANSWQDVPDDSLGYYDVEEYNAVLATGPKFGCIHHKTLPSEPPGCD